MPYFLWTCICLIAYVGGLIVLTKVTPQLLTRSYDDGLFMAIAAGDILGGLLVLGAVALTFGIFSGNIGIRILDFFLLVGVIVVAARLSMRSFRARRSRTIGSSRIAAGTYCLALALISLYFIILLFTSTP
jgi:hypothetical protein